MFKIKRIGIGSVVMLVVWVCGFEFAAAAIIQVDGRWDPNRAPALGGPVTPGCNGEPGLLPLPITIPQGMTSLIIQDSSGGVTLDGRTEPIGPDGLDLGGVAQYETAPGLSGVVSSRKGFLAGVLTANRPPSGEQPLDRDGDVDMASGRLSDVALYQLFGIGRRDASRPLEIVLPAGAELLWFFVIDGCLSRGAQLGGYPEHMETWQVEYLLAESVVSETNRVSVDSQGMQGNGPSFEPSISGDGRFVVFVSEADNLVPDDTNEVDDVFVHDRQTGQTTRVSVGLGGLEANNFSFQPSISGDGRSVVFASDADNLVPNDTNDAADIFVHDRQTGRTTRVNVSDTGREANDSSFLPSISANGRVVAFETPADNLVPDDTNDEQDVFVHDMDTGQTIRVSLNLQRQQIDHESRAPSVSSDGRLVAFQTTLEIDADVLIHDLSTGLVTRLAEGIILGGAANPSISGDGQVISFVEENSRFLSVYDRRTARTDIINTDENDSRPSISADGRFVAYGPEDNDFRRAVFVYELETGDITRVSVDRDGNPIESASFSPSISAQGRYIAFASNGENLVPDDNNESTDVFVYDRGR